MASGLSPDSFEKQLSKREDVPECKNGGEVLPCGFGFLLPARFRFIGS